MKYKGITIHKNKNCDTWYTRFRKNGKQYYISAKTQKECYNLLKQKINNPIKENNIKNITLNEWYDKWLSLYKINKVKQTTIDCYNSAKKHIPKELLEKQIKDISLSEILTSINDCKAERQKQNLYDLYNMLWSKAIDNEIIDKNIITRIEKPKHTKNHGQALDNNQQEILIEKSKQTNNADIILIALYQGLRRGEALGLTIDNINYGQNTLTINKAWNEKNQFDTTKNKQSIRTMPLFEESKKILINYKNKTERIFEITDRQLDFILDKIKKATNIKNLMFKDLRSTFITRCKELSIPKHIIQAWCGHVIGSSVTDTVYTKHNQDIDDKYINILNKTKFYSNSTHKEK